MITRLLTVCALLTMIFTASVLAQKSTPRELPTVPSLDLDRYSGKWFEIARYPNKFQKQCVRNTTATYTVKEKQRIEVLNECVTSKGTVKSAKGEAKVVENTNNTKLKVRFAPAFLSPFGFVWGDYWVVDLGPDYEYSVVGDPERKYLWILSRQPQIPEGTYQNILRRVEELGFEPGRLEKTSQGSGQ